MDLLPSVFPIPVRDKITESAPHIFYNITITIIYRGGNTMTNQSGVPNRKPRPKAVVNQRDCVACGCCLKVCPMNAIRIFRGIFAKVDESRCVGCGKCVRECPASVIALKEVSP